LPYLLNCEVPMLCWKFTCFDNLEEPISLVVSMLCRLLIVHSHVESSDDVNGRLKLHIALLKKWRIARLKQLNIEH
jgi:hypothetical protein